MDHDQRFKTLIQEFFVDFLQLFFAEWAFRLDLSSIEWLDKEIFPNPPKGPHHVLDLVARVPVKEAAQTPPILSLLLVHVEIESPDQTTLLKPRLPHYYFNLRDKYQLPVLPIVLYLKVGLDGIGTDTVVEELWDLEVNRFQYLYVGLPGLDGLKYVQGDSWLGVALSALMRIPREQVAWLGAEALRRLAGAPINEQKRFLLGDCVQAYLPLDEEQKQKLEQLLQTKEYIGIQAMNQTVYEKGIEQGRKAELVGLICLGIEERFCPVTEEMKDHLEKLPIEELRRMALKVGTASSLGDLGLHQ